MRRYLWSCLASLLIMHVFAPSVSATPFKSIVAFGDSLTDVGNVFSLTSSNPLYHPDPPPELGYVNGRLTNGNNWVDDVASLLGLPDPQASLNGGTNYAYAGAKSGLGTNARFPSPTYPPNPSLNVDRVGTQIDSYIVAHASFQSDQLVLLWAGANDLRDVVGPADILTVVNNLDGEIRTLAAAGAATIVVPNQLDLSLAPFFSSNPVQQQQALLVVTTFNTLLAARLQALRSDPTLDVNIIGVDMFGLSHEVVANPGAFGFTNITDPVVTFVPPNTFTIASNPNGYLFQDLIHPTAQFHQLIAGAVVDAIEVQEPGTFSLMGLGLVGLSFWQVRRKLRASFPRSGFSSCIRLAPRLQRRACAGTGRALSKPPHRGARRCI